MSDNVTPIRPDDPEALLEHVPDGAPVWKSGPIEILDADAGIVRVHSPIGALTGPKDQVFETLNAQSNRVNTNLRERVRAYEKARLESNLTALLNASVRWSDWMNFLETMQNAIDERNACVRDLRPH